MSKLLWEEKVFPHPTQCSHPVSHQRMTPEYLPEWCDLSAEIKSSLRKADGALVQETACQAFFFSRKLLI